MPDKRPKYDQHNPSQNSLQRWDNEGGATQRSRAQHPRDFSQADKLVEDISTGRVENWPPTPEEQGNDSAAARDRHATTIIDPRNQWPSRTWSSLHPHSPWTLSCRSSRKEWTTRPKGPLLRGGICYPFSFTIPHLNLKLSRLSWSTDRQPISFMSRSISARRFSSALSTPA